MPICTLQTTAVFLTMRPQFCIDGTRKHVKSVLVTCDEWLHLYH